MKRICKSTRLLSILIALVTVVTFTGCASLTNPAYYLGDSIEKTKNNLFNFDIANILSQAFKTGSVSMDISVDDETIPFNNLNSTFYFDQSKSTVISKMSAKVGSKTLDLNAYMSPKSYVLESDALLGNKAYGIALNDVSKNYPKSTFADEDSEFYIEMDNDQYKSFIKFCEQYSELVKTNNELSKFADKYEALLKNSIKKHAKTDRFREDGITYVSMEFDNASIAKIVKDLADKFKSDTELQKIILDYIRLLDLVGSSEYEDSLEKEYDEFIANGIDEFIEDIKFGEETKINIKTGTKNKIIKSIDATVEVEGETEISFTAEIGDEEEVYSLKPSDTSYTLIYDKLINSKNEYSAKITLKEKFNGKTTTLFNVKIDWDKKTEVFAISLDVIDPFSSSSYSKNDFMNITIKGSLQVTKDSFKLSIKKISVEDEVLEGFTFTFSAKSKVTMPSFPNYTDVLLMSEEQIVDLVEKVIDNSADISDIIDDYDFDFYYGNTADYWYYD